MKNIHHNRHVELIFQLVLCLDLLLFEFNLKTKVHKPSFREEEVVDCFLAEIRLFRLSIAVSQL